MILHGAQDTDAKGEIMAVVKPAETIWRQL
jgi:hypothetical protein